MKNTSNKTRFSFLRFSIRYLLLMVFAASCVLGWISWKIEAAKTELQLAREFESAGCKIEWSHWDKEGTNVWPEPGWNSNWLRNHWSSHVTHLSLNDPQVESLESLKPFKHLTKLHLNCPLLTDIEVMGKFANLETLVIRECGALTDIDSIGECRKLRVLKLFNGESVEDISFITHLENLEQLDLMRLPNARVADNTFTNACRLKSLSIVGVHAISDLDQFEATSSLESVLLEELNSLQDIDGLKRCTSLKFLSLRNCQSLQNLDGITNAVSLEDVSIIGCSSLQNIDGLKDHALITELG